MGPQIEPTLPFPREPLSERKPLTLRAIVARVGFWTPVWVPLIVLAQIALLGLGPALAENRRLVGASEELEGRLERERSERARLERVLRAQDDPIYLERERRLLRAGTEPQPVK